MKPAPSMPASARNTVEHRGDRIGLDEAGRRAAELFVGVKHTRKSRLADERCRCPARKRGGKSAQRRTFRDPVG